MTKKFYYLLLLCLFLFSSCNSAELRIETPMVSLTQSPTQSISATTALSQTDPPMAQSAQYTGTTAYLGSLLFTVVYDPSKWLFVPEAANPIPYLDHVPYLEHIQIANCNINLREGPREYDNYSELQLGTRKWFTSVYSETYMVYNTNVLTQSVIFGITLPPQNERSAKKECLQQSEQVLTTLQILP